MVPPEAVTGPLYAAPTVPLGREVVVTVRLLDWVGFEVPLLLLELLHPAISAVAPKIRLHPSFRMARGFLLLIRSQMGKYVRCEAITVSLCS